MKKLFTLRCRAKALASDIRCAATSGIGQVNSYAIHKYLHQPVRGCSFTPAVQTQLNFQKKFIGSATCRQLKALIFTYSAENASVYQQAHPTTFCCSHATMVAASALLHDDTKRVKIQTDDDVFQQPRAATVSEKQSSVGMCLYSSLYSKCGY